MKDAWNPASACVQVTLDGYVILDVLDAGFN